MTRSTAPSHRASEGPSSEGAAARGAILVDAELRRLLDEVGIAFPHVGTISANQVNMRPRGYVRRLEKRGL